MRIPLVPVLAAALLVVGIAGCSPTGRATTGCLDGTRPIIDAPDAPVLTYPDRPEFGSGTAVDARGSIFDSGSTLDVGIKMHHGVNGSDVCIVGGLMMSRHDPETTPWDTWHDHTATTIQEPDVTVIGQRYFNVGDAISFWGTATGWEIIGMRVDALLGGPKGGYVHDDCIEDDAMLSGTISDSKLDGCHIFLSASGSTADGSNEVVEVANTLVRLTPYYNSFKPEKYGFNAMGGFFKWGRPTSGPGTPPRLDVRDSIFRADQRARYGGNANGYLALPPGSTCRNVTLVAAGGWGSDPANPTHPGWQQRDIDSWRSQCTNLRFAGVGVWNAAVAEWDAAHPPLTDRGT